MAGSREKRASAEARQGWPLVAGRVLRQIDTGRTDTDHGAPAMSVDEANGARSRSEHIVGVVDRAVADELGSGRSS